MKGINKSCKHKPPCDRVFLFLCSECQDDEDEENNDDEETSEDGNEDNDEYLPLNKIGNSDDEDHFHIVV